MPPAISLSDDDKIRLQRFAPFFDIDFWQVDDQTYILRTSRGVSGCEVSLPAAVAHLRLFTEISSRATPWVYFSLGASCRDSLLEQSDARLYRVAQLYSLDRDALA